MAAHNLDTLPAGVLWTIVHKIDLPSAVMLMACSKKIHAVVEPDVRRTILRLMDDVHIIDTSTDTSAYSQMTYRIPSIVMSIYLWSAVKSKAAKLKVTISEIGASATLTGALRRFDIFNGRW